MPIRAPPASAVKLKVYGNKKGMGDSYSRPSLYSGLRIAPM